MSSDHNQAQLVVKKPRVSLDTIPEDAAMNIIKFVQDFASVGGNVEARIKASRLRDSTLRAVAMSSRGTFRVYQTALLTNLTLTLKDVVPFVAFLGQNPNIGGVIKSVWFLGREHLDKASYAEARARFFQASKAMCNVQLSLDSRDQPSPRVDVSKDLMGHIRHGSRIFMKHFYLRLGQTEKLVIFHPWTLPPFVNPRIDGLVPLHFFTSSLKHLHIARFTNDRADERLTANNALWLLIWCPHLESSTLGFAFRTENVDFLNEHREAFAGLSNVKYLALDFQTSFDKSNKKTWWGQSGGSESKCRGRTRKTQALTDLLAVTNQNLVTLELFQVGCELNEGDMTSFFSSCLLGLRGSAKSLTKLRMVGIAADADLLVSTAYGQFYNLKVLSLEQMPLRYVANFPEIPLPASLQVLVHPHSSYQSSEPEWRGGELNLVQLLKTRTLSKLRVVVVAAEPIDEWGEVVAEDLKFKQIWLERRRELEKLEIFKSGKIELRKLTLKQMIEDPYREDSFLSAIPWMSVPY